METHWNDTEVDTMPHRWPADTDFRLWELDVLDRDCASCGRMMHICDHRYRHFYTLEGPVELVCKLNHCPNPDCPGHAKTKSPEMEATIALPAWAIGWDVFCWIGHRRFARHWSIPQIRHELIDSYAIELTEPCIPLYVQRYQTMVAARQQDFEAMRRQYEGVDDIIFPLWGQTDLEFSPLRPRARSRAMRSRLAFDSLWSRAANRADRLGTLSGRERPRIGTSSARVASVWCFAR